MDTKKNAPIGTATETKQQEAEIPRLLKMNEELITGLFDAVERLDNCTKTIRASAPSDHAAIQADSSSPIGNALAEQNSRIQVATSVIHSIINEMAI